MITRDLQEDYNALDNKQSFFTVTPSILAGMPSLSDSDFRVLSVLTSFFNQYGETFVTDKTLAKTLNKSTSTIVRAISSLKDNGYIESEVSREGQFVSKRTIRPSKVYAKMIEGIVKNDFLGIVKSEGENNNRINNNKEYIGEDVKVTSKQKQTLLSLYGQDLTDRLVDKLSDYKLSNGKKYKSDYHALRGWVLKSVLESNPPRVLTKDQMIECEKKYSPIRSKYNYDQGSEKFRLK